MAHELPPITRIKREDIEDAPEWFDGFLDQLNQELEFLSSILDGGLTLGGNVSGTLKEVQVRTPATYTSGEFNEVRFETGLSRISACDIKQVIDMDASDSDWLTGAYSADWRGSGGEVRIRWISGLEASRRYWIRFHVW